MTGTAMINGCGAAILSMAVAWSAQPALSGQTRSPQPTMARPAPGRPLTNGQVISLSKSGLSDEALVEIIRASEPHFNLASVNLAILAQTGVSRRVIEEIQIAAEAGRTPLGARSEPTRADTHTLQPRGICVAVWCW